MGTIDANAFLPGPMPHFITNSWIYPTRNGEPLLRSRQDVPENRGREFGWHARIFCHHFANPRFRLLLATGSRLPALVWVKVELCPSAYATLTSTVDVLL